MSFVISFLVLFGSINFAEQPNQTILAEAGVGTIHIDVIVESDEGCRFHIIGDVSTNIFLEVTGFEGTVEGLGGPAGCPEFGP